jgi:hypothetical protein
MVSGSDQTGRAENSAMSGLLARQDPQPEGAGNTAGMEILKDKG